MKRAAQCLGLTDRRARQLDRLGRIAPPLLEAMRVHGIPPDGHLARIADAAPADQARVFKKYKGSAKQEPSWWQISRDLTNATISQTHAIFDLEKAKDVHWQEDVFAQPGSKEHYTTPNAAAFMKHQRAALEARTAARKKKGEAVEWVSWSEKDNAPEIPAGYERIYDTPPKSMKLGENDPRLLIFAIQPNGAVVQALVKKKGKRIPVKPAKGAPAPAAPDDTAAAEPAGEAPGPAEPVRTMTAAGRAMIAAAQTEALQTRFRQHGQHMNLHSMLRILCLALTGRNVAIHDAGKYGIVKTGDLQRRLLTSSGAIDGFATDTKEIAAELLARMVCISPTGGGSGRTVALAIGHHVAAHECLPAFDTPEFLATLSAATLKEAAAAVEITGAKTASALRERLAGKIGHRWAPKEADFEPDQLAAAEDPDAEDDGWGSEDPEGGESE